ncbi:hypothetical protein T439DRAFT_368699 [Meredithblackwellia eburnea MCA 4105]
MSTSTRSHTDPQVSLDSSLQLDDLAAPPSKFVSTELVEITTNFELLSISEAKGAEKKENTDHLEPEVHKSEQELVVEEGAKKNHLSDSNSPAARDNFKESVRVNNDKKHENSKSESKNKRAVEDETAANVQVSEGDSEKTLVNTSSSVNKGVVAPAPQKDNLVNRSTTTSASPRRLKVIRLPPFQVAPTPLLEISPVVKKQLYDIIFNHPLFILRESDNRSTTFARYLNRGSLAGLEVSALWGFDENDSVLDFVNSLQTNMTRVGGKITSFKFPVGRSKDDISRTTKTLREQLKFDQVRKRLSQKVDATRLIDTFPERTHKNFLFLFPYPATSHDTVEALPLKIVTSAGEVQAPGALLVVGLAKGPENSIENDIGSVYSARYKLEDFRRAAKGAGYSILEVPGGLDDKGINLPFYGYRHTSNNKEQDIHAHVMDYHVVFILKKQDIVS